ncbi:MAG: protein ImuA [Rhodobacteraceae bacterium HLUCCA12]|nr:MAG: protein ImuA [Rhodobacteraceae bacterium HLUCCA12]
MLEKGMFDHPDSRDQRPPLPAEAAALLARLERPASPPPPPLCPAQPLAFARGRVHELTGTARRTLATILAGAAQAEGPVFWLRPAWRNDRLCPQGLIGLADPGALIMVDCPRAEDVLWCMEEALRAGCVALVIAEFAVPPDLRQVRRLHLAAAEGLARSTGGDHQNATLAPLGLLMADEAAEFRLAGVESRWALHPEVDSGDWRLARRHSRALPPAQWRLRLETGGVRIDAA